MDFNAKNVEYDEMFVPEIGKEVNLTFLGQEIDLTAVVEQDEIELIPTVTVEVDGYDTSNSDDLSIEMDVNEMNVEDDEMFVPEIGKEVNLTFLGQEIDLTAAVEQEEIELISAPTLDNADNNLTSTDNNDEMYIKSGSSFGSKRYIKHESTIRAMIFTKESDRLAFKESVIKKANYFAQKPILEWEMKNLQNGTHPDYLDNAIKLKNKLADTLDEIKTYYDSQKKYTQKFYNKEIKAAKDEYLKKTLEKKMSEAEELLQMNVCQEIENLPDIPADQDETNNEDSDATLIASETQEIPETLTTKPKARRIKKRRVSTQYIRRSTRKRVSTQNVRRSERIRNAANKKEKTRKSIDTRDEFKETHKILKKLQQKNDKFRLKLNGAEVEEDLALIRDGIAKSEENNRKFSVFSKYRK